MPQPKLSRALLRFAPSICLNRGTGLPTRVADKVEHQACNTFLLLRLSGIRRWEGEQHQRGSVEQNQRRGADRSSEREGTGIVIGRDTTTDTAATVRLLQYVPEQSTHCGLCVASGSSCDRRSSLINSVRRRIWSSHRAKQSPDILPRCPPIIVYS